MYGQKPAQAGEYISGVQQIVAAELGPAFSAYTLEQVHATIIGLEGRRDLRSGQIINKNLEEFAGKTSPMDIGRLADLISGLFAAPLAAQFGGYEPTGQYGFTSRGAHPHERSFSIQGTAAVIIGWPASCGEGRQVLDTLRRSFQDANALHRYHTEPSAVDNDLYLVAGHIDRSAASGKQIFAATSRGRAFAARNPVRFDINQSDLSVVSYEEATLCPDTSIAYRVPVSAGQLNALY